MSQKNEPNKRIELLIDSIDGIVWEADAQTLQFTFVSKKAEKILGYSINEWLDDISFWPDHIHPDDKEWAVKYCIAATKQKQAHEFEYRMIAKDGRVVWLRDIVTVVAEDDRPSQICGIMIDITENKKKEETIRLSHEQLVNAELLGKTGHWNWDLKSGEVTWSEGTYRIFGEQQGKFKGTFEDFIQRINPVDKERIEKTIQLVYENRRSASYEFWIKTPDNKDRYIGTTAEVVLDNKGNLISIFGNTIDLTEIKRASEKIKNSYEEIKRLTEYLHNISEKERTYIAREIHDELGQHLSVMKMDIAWLQKKITTEDSAAIEKLERINDLLNDTMKTVRRISYSLRPSLLDDLGLVPAIEWHLTEFTRHSGIETFFNSSYEGVEIPDTYRIGIFRIFQESLTNVARHSNATNVIVDLGLENNHLVLRITDDGDGFNKERTNDKTALGLLGMRERTYMMGGAYQINSTPGKGTSIMVAIPIGKFAPIQLETESQSRREALG